MNTAGDVLVVVILIVVAMIIYYIYDTRKRTGVVRNLECTLTRFSGPVTIFEIHMQNGSIFYAGYGGHQPHLTERVKINFWPTWNAVLWRETDHQRTNKDGSITPYKVRRDYYALKKFRVIT